MRWVLLLISSYYFYMSWNVKYVVLILFTTVVSYATALLLEKTGDIKKRRRLLVWTLVACLGVLFVFKYFNFFSTSFAEILSAFTPTQVHPLTLKLLLPVGISFYTFQTLSYVIDVYRGDIEAERHFGYYATFVSFFPQLVAGPIERTKNLLPQIRQMHTFDEAQALYGAKLMLWGFFKKLAIADNLAYYVDRIFSDVYGYSGFSFFLSVFFFSIQIYCDFSGYSDIARGTAKLMGIDLMDNFKSPFFSMSVREVWERWHISLSTWFRDYVYIPLGGSRNGKMRRNINLMLTFVLSGLWHGANWTYVLWGGVNGLGQIIEERFGIGKKKPEKAFARVLQTLAVFVFFVLSTTFFRAQSIAESGYIWMHLLDGITDPVHYLWKGFADINMYKEILFGCCVLFFLPLAYYDYIAIKNNKNGVEVLDEKSKLFQWCFWLLIGLITLFLSPKGVPEDFVYFQF